MEPEASLTCSQDATTGPYPGPDAPSPHLPHPRSPRSILILSSHLRLRFPCGHFSSGFPTKILYTFLTFQMPAIRPTHVIVFDFSS